VKRSADKILTTHVGSLPGLSRLNPADRDYEDKLRASVDEVIKKQCETGLDVINEGEYTKGGDWLSYADNRFDGFEPRSVSIASILLQGKDREMFSDFYQYATERGTLFYTASVPLQLFSVTLWATRAERNNLLRRSLSYR
jgi:5-methyltetrahydropteroyltriglutamate--homocysteine methyltransferase